MRDRETYNIVGACVGKAIICRAMHNDNIGPIKQFDILAELHECLDLVWRCVKRSVGAGTAGLSIERRGCDGREISIGELGLFETSSRVAVNPESVHSPFQFRSQSQSFQRERLAPSWVRVSASE